MKFLIDMPLSPRLAVRLVREGHDAIHAVDLGFEQAPDTTILDYAQKELRIVVTADMDYPRLLSLTKAEGPGLILFRGGNYSERESEERLILALETTNPQELAHSIVVIEKRRIRQRHLPLDPNA